MRRAKSAGSWLTREIRMSFMWGLLAMHTDQTNSVAFLDPSTEGRIGTRFSMKEPKLVFQIWQSAPATHSCYSRERGIHIVLPGVRMLPSTDPAGVSTARKMRARRGREWSAMDCPKAIGAELALTLRPTASVSTR